MKRIVRTVCVILVLSMMLVIPAQAETNVEPRGSAFFAAYSTYLYKTSSTSFQIWFDVDANAAMMDKLGTSVIELYRSSNQQNWTKVKTYEMEDYPEMIDEYSYSHIDYVTYSNAWSGYYYCAYVTFYAKNSTGIGERYVYTGILKM